MKHVKLFEEFQNGMDQGDVASPVVQAGLNMLAKAQELLDAQSKRFEMYIPAVQNYLDTKKTQLQDPTLPIKQSELQFMVVQKNYISINLKLKRVTTLLLTFRKMEKEILKIIQPMHLTQVKDLLQGELVIPMLLVLKTPSYLSKVLI